MYVYLYTPSYFSTLLLGWTATSRGRRTTCEAGPAGRRLELVRMLPRRSHELFDGIVIFIFIPHVHYIDLCIRCEEACTQASELLGKFTPSKNEDALTMRLAEAFLKIAWRLVSILS